ncbi:MAG: ATP:cob(I)alamin adenosyltransferase [Sulfobacillus acidophilus]|uniref:Corrinoid adenosyltransferase n=1 Tax=Sulfobacillus acidophilus TaxID=53633 RepID=A0A2T2WCX3_9FIRM|nr:MAG: ATP:cob(I)alamin adenosyltransferase [Sulfobacillus acidophilus]
MKIYTKAGDLGDTSLWGKAGPKRTRKDSLRVESYGAVDEANAWIGMARAWGVSDATLDHMLEAVQHRLFSLGADLANINENRSDRVREADLQELEGWIDSLDTELPVLKQFILPGGVPAAAALQVARTVVRRAERRLVSFLGEDSSYGTQLKFLNRLSDFLFVAARRVNHLAGLEDTPAQF